MSWAGKNPDDKRSGRMAKLSLVVGMALGTVLAAICYGAGLVSIYHQMRPAMQYPLVYVVAGIILASIPSMKGTAWNILWDLICVPTFLIGIYFY